MILRARLGAAALLVCAVGCGDTSDVECTGAIAPGALVTDAALFRVDLYYALTCDALATAESPVATLSRAFAAGTPIVLDVPPGGYAVVVTSYADAGGTDALGTACADATFKAGARPCLSPALGAVDLAGAASSPDLGDPDLAGADLAHVAGATLAQDNFQRANQRGWGTASDGQIWGGSATTMTFSIAAGVGQVASGGNTAYPANLGPLVSDAEAQANGTIVAGAAQWGVQLRNGANATTYAAMLGGGTLAIQRVVNGIMTVLSSSPFTTTAGTGYSIRFRAVGGTLEARAWTTGVAEPSAWTVTTTDAMPLGPGYGGMRFYVPASSYVNITSFQLLAR